MNDYITKHTKHIEDDALITVLVATKKKWKYT